MPISTISKQFFQCFEVSLYWLLRHIYVLAHKINSKSKFLAEIMHWRFPWTHCSTFLDISKILTIFSKIQFYTTIFSQNWISRRVLKSSQSLLSENNIRNQVWSKNICTKCHQSKKIGFKRLIFFIHTWFLITCLHLVHWPGVFSESRDCELFKTLLDIQFWLK